MSEESKKKKGKSWRITDGDLWIKVCKGSAPLKRISSSFFTTPTPNKTAKKPEHLPELNEQNASSTFSLREFPVGQAVPRSAEQGVNGAAAKLFPLGRGGTGEGQTLGTNTLQQQ